MNITKHHSRQLAYSPPFKFVIRAYSQMLDTDQSHPSMKFTNRSEVVWLRDEDVGRVVAANVFVVDELGCAYTQLTFVDPDYRGRGLAPLMYSWLRDVLLQRLGTRLNVIYTDTVEENSAMRAVLGKTGRDAYTVRGAEFFNGANQE